jgi:hypothetical protein
MRPMTERRSTHRTSGSGLVNGEDVMRFAGWVLRIAGIYGLVVLLPQYFLEEQVGRDSPPPVTHPEYFYGFVGVAVAWQVAFLLIAQDPGRYRPLMIPAVLEKATFGIAVLLLFAQQRLAGVLLVFGIIDVIWLLLFLAAFRRAPGQVA